MKIICVGQNYKSHAEEMNAAMPSSEVSPILFMKPDSAILTDDKGRFFVPDFSTDVHYEVELVVKINKMGKNIAERFAHRYYEEVTVGIDFTARDLQARLKSEGKPWEIAKAFDNSAVLGKFINKNDLGKAVGELDFEMSKNDQTVQSANSSQMVHSVDQIIAYASQYFTLKTGDLIFTGTPAGVGSVAIGDRLKGFLEKQQLFEVVVC